MNETRNFSNPSQPALILCAQCSTPKQREQFDLERPASDGDSLICRACMGESKAKPKHTDRCATNSFTGGQGLEFLTCDCGAEPSPLPAHERDPLADDETLIVSTDVRVALEHLNKTVDAYLTNPSSDNRYALRFAQCQAGVALFYSKVP